MLRLEGKGQLPEALVRPVVTLGTFDGVHLGHQAVIRETIEWAEEIEGTSVIVTFDHHPRAVLGGMAASFITSLEHRLVLFERLGIDVCAVLKFNHDLAQISAEDFVKEYFCKWLGASGVMLGYDCRFGNGARGNVDLVHQLAPDYGFEARACEQTSLGNLLPSSTSIRHAITSGQLSQASQMLGRPVSILGRVVKGNRRGHTIGFPTANLDPLHEIVPPGGVYACRVELDGDNYEAVSNIGLRPTVSDQTKPTIESHILDYEADLYGRDIEVQFIEHLRSEKKFSGLEELKTQIAKDVEKARTILSK